MNKLMILPLALLLGITACKKDKKEEVITEPLVYPNDHPATQLNRIAFGSCFFQQLLPQNIFTYIEAKNPDLYLGIGDNIYSDDYSGANHDNDWTTYLTAKYKQISTGGPFQSFRNKVPFITVWDDHDFGPNNSAGDFKNKQGSKEVFFDFWQLPKSGDRWNREGIYDAFYYGDTAHKIQIIVLDMRWGLDKPGSEPIAELIDTTKKMLSNVQWDWLKEELKRPAKVRIICSSTQFCTEHNGFEAWANFPHEQERMYRLLKETHAEGAFFLSGDVHIAETNKRQPPGMYPLWDFTSSGLATIHGGNARPSQYRVGTEFDEDNFGMLDIDWTSKPVKVKYTAFNKTGVELYNNQISMGDLKF
jgi:alkaline phosphatase D